MHAGSKYPNLWVREVLRSNSYKFFACGIDKCQYIYGRSFGPPSQGPHIKQNANHHVLLVIQGWLIIQHSYESVQLQILVFLHSVKIFASRMGWWLKNSGIFPLP